MTCMFLFRSAIILFAGLAGVLTRSSCVDHSLNVEEFWCEGGCCGSYGHQKCCTSPRLIVGILVGSLIFVALVVTALVVVLCCCRRSRGQPGKVCQPAVAQATTVQMHSLLPYGQVGYNGTVNNPATVMTSNVTSGTTQSWQQPISPTRYEEVNQN